MADSKTSFNSYTFTYKWKVSDLETRLLNSKKLSSPEFSSPFGAWPATSWLLTVFNGNVSSAQTPPDADPAPAGEQSVSVELKRQPYGFLSTDADSEDVWVETRLKSQSSNFDDLTGFEATSVSQGPTKLSNAGMLRPFGSDSDSGGPSANEITFDQFLPLFKIQDAQSITFKCEIKVFSQEPPLPTSKPNFSLTKFMEEARQNNLFTDVTLMADGNREFKAHKVILASQSQFFKTRFSGRWVSPSIDDTNGDKIEMTDVPVIIMEAMLSYMYTGKVANIGKISQQLLPFAEEYGLVGLRRMCEEDLIQSLTSTTVVNMLIHAAAHNASDLKKACIEFIVSNTAAVRQTEGWAKLKKDQAHHDLWMEVLESI